MKAASGSKELLVLSGVSFSLGFEYLTGDELGGTSGIEAGLPMQET